MTIFTHNTKQLRPHLFRNFYTIFGFKQSSSRIFNLLQELLFLRRCVVDREWHIGIPSTLQESVAIHFLTTHRTVDKRICSFRINLSSKPVKVFHIAEDIFIYDTKTIRENTAPFTTLRGKRTKTIQETNSPTACSRGITTKSLEQRSNTRQTSVVSSSSTQHKSKLR